MLIGETLYMEDADMTEYQIAAAKKKNMDVVLSLAMKKYLTKG